MRLQEQRSTNSFSLKQLYMNSIFPLHFFPTALLPLSVKQRLNNHSYPYTFADGWTTETSPRDCDVCWKNIESEAFGVADGELKIHESPQAVEEETLTLLHLPLLCKRGSGVMGGQGCPTSPRQRRS